MKRINLKSIAILVVSFLLVFLVYYGCISISYYVQISPVGGKNEETAIKISQKDTIKINISTGKIDHYSAIVIYWDDAKESKEEISKDLFLTSREIEIPDSPGIHKLTIERGRNGSLKYHYYYEVSQ